MARLYRVIVPVTDIAKARRFYEAVLGVEGKDVSAGRVYFDCDGVVLACLDAKVDGDDTASSPHEEPLYLAVADLAATRVACRDQGASFPDGAPPGVGPLGEIVERPWGEVSFYAVDPFGNHLCFVRNDTAFTG